MDFEDLITQGLLGRENLFLMFSSESQIMQSPRESPVMKSSWNGAIAVTALVCSREEYRTVHSETFHTVTSL